MTVRIACCQISPDVGDPAASAAAASRAIAAAVDEGAQIVLLPELVNSGYVFDSVDEARAAAVPADGELLQSWAEEAGRGDAVVVAGFCEKAADARLFNSAALLDGTGVLAVYRKLHLWAEERRWFTAGVWLAGTELSGEPLQKAIQRQGVTHLTVPPAALATIDVDGTDTLETVIVAGESCAGELAARPVAAGRPPRSSLTRRDDRLLEPRVRRRLRPLRQRARL